MEFTEAFTLQTFLQQVTEEPGIYRMQDSEGAIIYVGKAKNLKKRLSSYLINRQASPKQTKLMEALAAIEVTVTRTETEALLLEHHYIRLYQPKYNILLKDDKAYPYIGLTHEPHPKIFIHRGEPRQLGDYFGPFPEAQSVKTTLRLLETTFKLRTCQDSVYRHRTRPCLNYELKRCSAPCVKGFISDEDYQGQVERAKLFLQGNDLQLIADLVTQMEQQSGALRFEAAAALRDQIQALRAIIERQSVVGLTGDWDILTAAVMREVVCIQVLFIRFGRLYGTRSYFPKVPLVQSVSEVYNAFLGQFYLETDRKLSPPKFILLDFPFANRNVFLDALKNRWGFAPKLLFKPKPIHKELLNLAQKNAANALRTRLVDTTLYAERWNGFANRFGIRSFKRLECFDVSHTQGEATVASCVVFTREGPQKQLYRRYSIRGITPGDDYAAIEQALNLRYAKRLAGPSTVTELPEAILIDGGKGQLKKALLFFQAQQGSSVPEYRPTIIGVAKGAVRKPGHETLFVVPYGTGIVLLEDAPEFRLIQHCRDEAHRHALTGHRKRRESARKISVLERIKGIGAQRRKHLLNYFGGLKFLLSATHEEFLLVPGISTVLAGKIFAALKEDKLR